MPLSQKETRLFEAELGRAAINWLKQNLDPHSLQDNVKNLAEHLELIQKPTPKSK